MTSPWRLTCLASFIAASLHAPADAESLAPNTDSSQQWQVSAPQGEFDSVNIDISEATWMNVDISPDGKTLVFDVLGDIYKMPVSGGQAVPLAKGIEWNMQPRFSPDGQHIAFTSDRDGGDNIWIMNTDGSHPRAVSQEKFRLLNGPAWSPDGNYIVARKHFTDTRSLGAGEVWLYHVNGGSGVTLTPRPNDQKDLGEPAFSPDGRYLYFSQDATPGKTFHYSKDSVKGIYKIKRVDRQSGETKVLIEGMGGAIRPTPSPDGTKLAYIARDEFQSSLYIYDIKSGSRQKIYGQLDRDMQETWAIHGVYPSMAWTPDNKAIVFWAGGQLRRLALATGQAEVIPFTIRTTKKVQKALRFDQPIDQDEFQVKMLRQVQISPNGEQVAFEALGKIWIRTLPDGKPQRLTQQDDHFELYPQWSRDGKKLVYTTWDDQRQGSIRLVNARTGRGQSLTSEPGKYVEPTFSPDGTTIVFRKSAGGSLLSPQWSVNPGIYRVSSKGGQASLISETGTQPQFGDDNQRVFLMEPGDKQQFVSVSLDGYQRRVHYTSKLATEFRIAPDGQTVAFAEGFKVFVTPFTKTASTVAIAPQGKNLPVKQLSQRAGENISWTSDSQQLYWSLGPDLYTHQVAGLFELTSPQQQQAEPLKAKSNPIGFTAKTDVPRGTIALVGAKVITMEGEEIIENGIVIVEGKRITAVGRRDDITIPKKAKIVDISGKTIIPGLVDAHAHGSQGDDEIIPEQSWRNFSGLSFGVTTIHDPSNDTTEVFTASELQKAGEIVGPRIFSTGTIIYGARGAGYTSHIDNLEDARFHLERLKKVGAFSVKSYNQPRRDQRQQVIQAGRELEMMVVPEGGSLLQHDLSMIADGHTTIEHSIPTAAIYDDVKQFWSQAGTAYTPTLVVAFGGIWGENYWYDKTDVWVHPKMNRFVPAEQFKPRSMRRTKAPESHYNHVSVAHVAKELADMGVQSNIGAHGQREGLGAHWEIWMFAQGGMSPLQALQTATINPARTLGLDKHIGSIKPGKLADLAIIDGDPLQNIRVTDRVVYTMINGRLYDADTLNEMGNSEKKRQSFYFE